MVDFSSLRTVCKTAATKGLEARAYAWWMQCRIPNERLVSSLLCARAARSKAVCWGFVLAGFAQLHSACAFAFAFDSASSSKASRFSLVRIKMLINCFMLDGQVRGNMSRAPLNAQQITGSFTYPCLNSWNIATVLPSIGRNLASLLGAVTPRASVATQIPTDVGLVPVRQFGYLRLLMSDFHECMNMISFS